MDFLGRIENIIKQFTEKKISLSLAESCTGGYVSHMLTNISGSSNIFERGVVSYSNQSKVELLNVKSEDILKYGTVSEQVAKQMAEGIRTQSKTDIGIGITGIAGPTGDTPTKPLGLVYIGCSNSIETVVRKFIFKTDRINFKNLVLNEVLKYLEAILDISRTVDTLRYEIIQNRENFRTLLKNWGVEIIRPSALNFLAKMLLNLKDDPKYLDEWFIHLTLKLIEKLKEKKKKVLSLSIILEFIKENYPDLLSLNFLQFESLKENYSSTLNKELTQITIDYPEISSGSIFTIIFLLYEKNTSLIEVITKNLPDLQTLEEWYHSLPYKTKYHDSGILISQFAYFFILINEYGDKSQQKEYIAWLNSINEEIKGMIEDEMEFLMDDQYWHDSILDQL